MAAAKDHPKTHTFFPCPVSFFLLSLLCFLSLFFLFSVQKRSDTFYETPPLFESRNFRNSSNRFCNYSDGRWVRAVGTKLRYDHTCKEIFRGWNCISSRKSNGRELNDWRWQPRDCDLPSFEPLRFLQRFRDTNIGFVGDSLNRNMFVSIVCTLKRASIEVKKWRPAGADRGFTFLEYNLTIAYHRTNLLAHYGGTPVASVVH